MLVAEPHRHRTGCGLRATGWWEVRDLYILVQEGHRLCQGLVLAVCEAESAHVVARDADADEACLARGVVVGLGFGLGIGGQLHPMSARVHPDPRGRAAAAASAATATAHAAAAPAPATQAALKGATTQDPSAPPRHGAGCPDVHI